MKRMQNVSYASVVLYIMYAMRGDTKSQTGYVFILNGGAVVWKSFKQSTTAQHVTEAEYISASQAAKEAVWIRKFIDELGVVPSNNYLLLKL
nr:putative retrotransposon protein [Tanacetum cinerariifolium]